MKNLLILSAMFTSPALFAAPYVSLNGQKASDLVQNMTSDTFYTVNNGTTDAKRTFTVDTNFSGNYSKFQVGGNKLSLEEFTIDILDDNTFTIPSILVAERPSELAIDFTGTGKVKYDGTTLAANAAGKTTTWNFNSEGGLSITGASIEVNNTNIVNVANLSTSSATNITLNGNAQFNIASKKVSEEKTISTSSVALGQISLNGSSSFSAELTGTGESTIKKIVAEIGSDVKLNLSATGTGGYITISENSSLGATINTIKGSFTSLSYDSSKGDVSFVAKDGSLVSASKISLGNGLVTGNAKMTNLSWNNATKTGLITLEVNKVHQNSVALHFGEGVDFEVVSEHSIEGSYSFNNVKNVDFNAQLYVEDSGSLVVSGTAGSVKLLSNKPGMWIKKATVTFNSSNVFATTAEGSTQKDVILTFARNGGKLVINADNDFGTLELSNNSSVPTVDIELNGNNLTFTKISIALENSEVIFSDFITDGGSITVSNRIVTVDGENDSALKNIYALDANGAKVNLYQWADGSLRAVAVPEPSTYAMIFGAIALGFVAYRRAKVRGRA